MGIEQCEWDLALYGRVYFRWEERGVEGGREVVGRGSGRAVLCPDPPPPPPTHTQAAYFVTLDVVALRLRAYQVAERVHNYICT